jgi:hypothetical protein
VEHRIGIKRVKNKVSKQLKLRDKNNDFPSVIYIEMPKLGYSADF